MGLVQFEKVLSSILLITGMLGAAGFGFSAGAWAARSLKFSESGVYLVIDSLCRKGQPSETEFLKSQLMFLVDKDFLWTGVTKSECLPNLK